MVGDIFEIDEQSMAKKIPIDLDFEISKGKLITISVVFSDFDHPIMVLENEIGKTDEDFHAVIKFGDCVEFRMS